MFIHHSVGQNWLDNSLRTALDAKSYVDEVNEITYNDVVAPDAGRPSSLGAVPGDNTNMCHWLFWFNDYFQSVRSFGCASGTNRIIMFKSCFPNSHIDQTGVEPGNPFDETHTIVNHQAVFRHPSGTGNSYTNGGATYLPLEDVFAANPTILFIPVLAPPECYAEATATTGDNARAFSDWLKNTWLPAYRDRTGLNNVAVFDFLDVLANADSGASHSNMLKTTYGGDTNDSHPNSTANETATQIFATGAPNFIDVVWGNFNGAITHYVLTMEASPYGGGVTSPALGASDAHAPVVISATAAEGYRFVNWTVAANGTVYNTESPTTTLLMSGATTATATFAATPYMTCGSTTVVEVGDLTNFTGTAFGAKPTPSAAYTDPVSGSVKTASLKATFDKAHADRFTAEWTKKVVLFNKKSIPVGTTSQSYLLENPLVDLICAFSVKATNTSKVKGIYSAGEILVPPPRITAIQNAAGETITTAAAGSTR